MNNVINGVCADCCVGTVFCFNCGCKKCSLYLIRQVVEQKQFLLRFKLFCDIVLVLLQLF